MKVFYVSRNALETVFHETLSKKNSVLPLRFKEKVKSGIIMISWNDFHKLLIAVFGIPQKPLN